MKKIDWLSIQLQVVIFLIGFTAGQYWPVEEERQPVPSREPHDEAWDTDMARRPFHTQPESVLL